MSSNPALETKLELVTEAIEALVLATVVATSSAPKFTAERQANFKNVADARATVSEALRQLLTPTLRVMTNPAPPVKHEVVPFSGMGIDGMNLA